MPTRAPSTARANGSILSSVPRHTSLNGNGSHQSSSGDALTATESIALFMENSPAHYARIVELLEQGHSPAGAAALVRVPLALVRKVRNLLGPDALHAAIIRSGRNLIESGQLLSERLANEAPAKIPIENVHSALSVVIDKSQLLVGAPTMSLEHKSAPSAEDVQKCSRACRKSKSTSVTNKSPSTPAAAKAALADPTTQVKATSVKGFLLRPKEGVPRHFFLRSRHAQTARRAATSNRSDPRSALEPKRQTALRSAGEISKTRLLGSE